MKFVVGAAIVIVALLLVGVFRRAGWKKKPHWGPGGPGGPGENG
jgi:hypothetical protein